MFNKSVVIGAILIGGVLTTTTNLNAHELLFTEDMTSGISVNKEQVISEDMFFSDDVFIISKYGEQKALEEKKLKEEQDKKKESSKSSSGKYIVPTVNTSQVGKLRLSIHNDDYDTMVRKCNAMLASDAMAGQGENLVNAGIAYNIDPYILVGIAKVETTGGTYPHAKYNAWGRMTWNGPNWRWATWNSWKESIYDQAAYLANYLNNGRTTLYAIGERYNPYHTEYWTNKVTKYQRLTANK